MPTLPSYLNGYEDLFAQDPRAAAFRAGDDPRRRVRSHDLLGAGAGDL